MMAAKSEDMANAKVKRGDPHWYFTYIEECPVCGASRATRERRAGGTRPDDFDLCYLYEVIYDNFMY